MTRYSRYNVARGLIILGFVLGLGSIGQTFAHIFDPLYLLAPENPTGRTHGWYHFFREGIGDFAKMGAILILLWGPKTSRTPVTWWVCAVLMFGFYAPFWIGWPFSSALGPPMIWAEVTHQLMMWPTVIGLFLARREFYQLQLTANTESLPSTTAA